MALNLSRQAIRNELDADPLGLGYDGMTDAEAAEALNSQRDNGTEQVAVSYAEVLDRAAASEPVRNALEGIFAAQSTSPAARQFVERMRYVGSLSTAEGTGGYDILLALVADSVITTQQAQTFAGWGEQALPTSSRAEDLWGVVTITEADVQEARAL